MTDKKFGDIKPLTFVGVTAFEVDLHKYEVDGEEYYNPSVGMHLDIGDGKESLIYLSTEIYEEDPRRAIFYAVRIATGFSSDFYPEVLVIDENDTILEETYNIREIIETIQEMSETQEKIPEGVTIH
jgi:hypothetical protein